MRKKIVPRNKAIMIFITVPFMICVRASLKEIASKAIAI